MVFFSFLFWHPAGGNQLSTTKKKSMPPTLLLRRLRTTTQWEGQRFILFNCTGSECEEVFVILCLYLKRCLWIKNVPMRELLTGRLIGATSVFASLSLSFFFFKSMKLTRWKSNSACRWGHRVAGVPSSKKSFFFPFFLSRSIPSFSPFISILFT